MLLIGVGIKKKIKDLMSVEIKYRLLYRLIVCKNLYAKNSNARKVKRDNLISTAAAQYKSLLYTAEYFSLSLPKNQKLISKTEKNSKKTNNFKTIKSDKKLLQNYYNRNLKAKNLPKARGLLKEYQTRILNLTKEVVLPLQNEIGFSLNAGSLIGALRHDGFIPWDDDMDLDILRDDCFKLEKIIKEKYIFADSSECKCYEDWYRLVDKTIREHPNEIIWTDAKGFLQAYKGISFSNCAFCDFFVWEFIKPNVKFSAYEKWWNEFAKVYKNPKLNWGEIRAIYLNELNSNKIFSSRDNSKYIACTLTQFDKPRPARFEKLNTFLPYKKHKFEDTEFCIPNDYNTYLARDFKNWRIIPTEIQFAKHIRLYNDICPPILSDEFYINYDDVCKQENYLLKSETSS